MPGSSAPPSETSSKAKVTSASTTNNSSIFVRPVAVAGIFRPPNESDNKPPAIPEKRRFSALVGDLRPCSTDSGQVSADFNRRRQSWDTKQKESPFGQSLLRKTPRSTVNSNVKTHLSEESKCESSESKVSSVPNDKISSAQITITTKAVISNPSEAVKKTSVVDTPKEGSIKSEVKINGNCISDAGSKVVSSSNGILCTDKDIISPKLETPFCENKSVSSIDNFKQPKKVYGLIKRESKSNIPNSQCDSDPCDKSATVNVAPNKVKVYGISKSLKKDSEIVSHNSQTYGKQINDCNNYQNLQFESKQKDESNVSQSLQLDNKQNCENNVIISKPISGESNKDSLQEEKAVRTAVSPPKDFRTVRRTSDVIAAKIQNIFSNFQSEKSTKPIVRKGQTLDKRNSCVDLKTETPKTDIKIISERNVNNELLGSNKKEISGPVKNNEISTEENSNKFNLKVSDVKQDVKIDNAQQKHTDPIKELTTNDKQIKKQLLKKCATLETENKHANNSKFVADVSSNTAAVSKTEVSTSVLSCKQQDKKLTDIEGKMPTKKTDQKISDAAISLPITSKGEVDRNLFDTSVSSSSSKDPVEKFDVAKKQTTSKASSISSNFSSMPNSTLSSDVKVVSKSDLSKTKLSQSSIENGYKNCSQALESTQKISESSSQSLNTIDSLDKSYCSNSVVFSVSSKTSVQNNISSNSISNGSIEKTELSKVEITKITPSTTPGIVPTVNVLFRTRSPQDIPNRDENRKKVVIETCTNTSVISPTVIIPPVNKTLPSSSAADSVKEAFKTLENVQKSLTPSSVPKKHSIVNLRKEEMAVVSLSSATKSSESKDVITVNSSVGSCIVPSSPNSVSVNTSIAPNIPKVESRFSVDNNILASSTHSVPDVSNFEYSSCDSKMSVLDLNDWNKKFQNLELEAPRAPMRRRFLRDSLPPSLPTRSVTRYGSLRRIEDSPRYVPRSPSQSSLPQRYSYTEMLSKVCSMGVLPFTQPVISKSCSSSSSQVSELWSELSEEQSTATHASEMLEAETTERMRLEKEVHELQNRYSQVQQRSDKMEMEMIETRMFRSPEINGDLSDDDEVDANSSIYKQKYERAVRDMELMKRRMQQQQEEEMEQKAMMKKASEKRLAEAMEDIEEERQVANQWKRKAQKLGAELQDLRLMLEEQMGRNGELEKKQRRFDAELSSAQEEIKKERLLREKLTREKDQAMSEKYTLEQDLQSAKMDSDLLHEKITQLNRELDELTLSSKGEEEVTQLKRTKQELERKCRDQEEELEELAAQVQMLEQAKLRLEMSLEKVRQEHRREASVREEEIEEIRASFSKKLKNIEAQLEAEQDERHQLMKQKHELERRIYELADQPPPHDPEIERRLRRDLKRTKALLRDAQSMLEHTREGQSSKTLIRQLKNQLEDSEFAKATAIKARQAVESELQECQLQLEEVTRVKNEAESRCLQLSREKSAIQTQLEEAEEEMAEVMKKYKAVVAQMSIDQKTLAEQTQQIAELETERQMLKDQLSEVSHKFEHLAGQSDDTHKVHWLDSKIRDLESKLELEQTTKTRLENQIARLKEQNDRAREECDALRNKEVQAQEGVRRLQRQLRDLREDYSALQQKEAEAYRKQHELEMAMENTETDLQVTKNDLRLACQRIQDLQNALEDDLDSGTDVPDDSGSDSDESFELSVLRNSSVTPVQRCDSVASNLSYCTTEEVRSRGSSFSRELPAFSSRDDVTKDVNGLSGVNSPSPEHTE